MISSPEPDLSQSPSDHLHRSPTLYTICLKVYPNSNRETEDDGTCCSLYDHDPTEGKIDPLLVRGVPGRDGGVVESMVDDWCRLESKIQGPGVSGILRMERLERLERLAGRVRVPLPQISNLCFCFLLMMGFGTNPLPIRGVPGRDGGVVESMVDDRYCLEPRDFQGPGILPFWGF